MKLCDTTRILIFNRLPKRFQHDKSLNNLKTVHVELSISHSQLVKLTIFTYVPVIKCLGLFVMACDFHVETSHILFVNKKFYVISI